MPSILRSMDELCNLPDSAYLTTFEAAIYLHTSHGGLAIRRMRGDGPDYCQNGRLIRYRKKSLDEFMDSNNNSVYVLKNSRVAENG